MARLDPERQLESAMEQALRSGVPPLRLAMLRVYRAHHAAWMAYVPKPYEGDVLFVRAAEERLSAAEDPIAYWKERVRGRLEVHVVAAAHNEVLGEPHVCAVAELLAPCLVPGAS